MKQLVVAILFLSTFIINKNTALSQEIIYSERYASIVADLDHGNVKFARNADKLRYPASLTKVMTLLLTFEALEKKQLSLNTKLTVSRNAAKQPRSNLSLKIGEKITVKDAIDGLIVRSANDASVVLAEAISGNQYAFVKKMNQMAKQLGMNKTRFVNPNGLHDPNQVTTAEDMVKLGRGIYKKFPKYYKLFSKTSFHFRNKLINGHNGVLKNYHGATGLKTGYVAASGFNLITTINRPEGKLIGVVMGGDSQAQRDDHMVELLDSCLSTKKQSKNLNQYAKSSIFNVVDQKS